MVTFNIVRYTNGQMNGKAYVEGSCLSSDTKPTTNIENGSKLMEMDTSTLYNFDEESRIWRPW